MTISVQGVLLHGGERDRRRAALRTLVEAGYPVRLSSSLAEASKAIADGGLKLVLLLAGAETDETDTERAAAALAPLGLEGRAITLLVVRATEADESERLRELVRQAVGPAASRGATSPDQPASSA